MFHIRSWCNSVRYIFEHKICLCQILWWIEDNIYCYFRVTHIHNGVCNFLKSWHQGNSCNRGWQNGKEYKKSLILCDVTFEQSSLSLSYKVRSKSFHRDFQCLETCYEGLSKDVLFLVNFSAKTSNFTKKQTPRRGGGGGLCNILRKVVKRSEIYAVIKIFCLYRYFCIYFCKNDLN